MNITIHNIFESSYYMAVIMFIIMPLNGFIIVNGNAILGMIALLLHIPWFIGICKSKEKIIITKTIESKTDYSDILELIEKLPDSTNNDWTLDFTKLIDDVHLVKHTLKKTIDKK